MENPLKCNKCGCEDQSNFYAYNQTRCKTCQSSEARSWAKKNLTQFRYVSARNRAKYKGYEFTITLEDVKGLLEKQNNKCVYCGRTFDHSDWYTFSIDRIDNKKGYTVENVQLVANGVNYMKSYLNTDDFLAFIEEIYNHSIKR